MGRLRRAGPTQPRGVRRLLVHCAPPAETTRTQQPRGKQARVLEGAAHAALLIDDDGLAQGWAHLHLRRLPPPSSGVAHTALAGALELIARAGGGLVEAISEVTMGREARARFLFSATVETFEEYGFTRGRQVGRHAWIVSRVVEAA